LARGQTAEQFREVERAKAHDRPVVFPNGRFQFEKQPTREPGHEPLERFLRFSQRSLCRIAGSIAVFASFALSRAWRI
jgi:hypothetical protein